ncbi:gamma-glutamyltransferase [uncultured Microbacterium sp.]|uniref:gamma-glutamyltransferase n=1 Tax=uncultured Microbacterium sp. TaxID=191216 RepID=UPI0035CC3A5D
MSGGATIDGGRSARQRLTGAAGEVIRGRGGAAATAHPAATRAALDILVAGGSAVDAAIAAQAVIATVMPEAAGLGGDLLVLVHRPGHGVVAVNGVGRSPSVAPARWTSDGGASVTVPGLVDGWMTLHAQGGRLSLGACLAPAIRLAAGAPLDASVVAAVGAQRRRLDRYGGSSWSLMSTAAGQVWRQPELASLLTDIASEGRAAFYQGAAAGAIEAAVARHGGSLSAADLAAHRTGTPEPIGIAWDRGILFVQPPPAQGVLLAMAAAWLEQHGRPNGVHLDHLLVELTDAAFAHRSTVVTRGADLLTEMLAPNLDRASRRGGARAYLHTAGVAVADADGTVVSSLVSVFDDFGSAVYVPDLGIVLGNRAAGFTSGDNAPAPARFPVHTLAPALIEHADGAVTALATPGADGQVQTLLQLLAARRYDRAGWQEALTRPRWRTEDGRLLVEKGHAAADEFTARSHDVLTRPHGDPIFGAVVIAGTDAGGPFAAADPRRGVQSGGLS